MDSCAKRNANDGKYLLNDYKVVKVMRRGNNSRIAFQRKCNKYTRGLSISKDGLCKMEDVTITPGMEIELESNVYLKNYGKQIHMVKYCMTRDAKRCDGGFFAFTPGEWIYFWTNIRAPLIEYMNK